MEPQTIFTGKTVEEAINNGIQQLGLTQDEVIIEIVKEGRKGILKVGSRDAEVRITAKKSQESQEQITHTFKPQNEQTPSNTSIKGSIWVKNGIIQCTNPDEGELIVHIPPKILFYKNNELLKDNKVTVTESDQLKVEFKQEEIPTKWTIEMSKDRLKALLKVVPGSKTIYTLRDLKPAREITLEAIEEVEPNLTITPDDIYEKLESMGISYGIIKNQIEQACISQEKAEFVIAKGQPAVEGKHGWLEYKVEIQEGKRFIENEDGTINYREGKFIPSVDEGLEIAIIHDPVEGTEGKSITGEPIPPKPVHPLQVKVGNGAMIKDQSIISTSIGRPSVQKKANTVVVEVVPKFEHRGDVTLASGNLKFNGDIVISGNVEENMEVIASGLVEINGTTSQAKIKAGQSSIHHSNVISSEIIAGNSDKITAEKSRDLTEIYEELKQMQKDLIQISQSPAFANVNTKESIMPLIRALIQTKYTALVKRIREFVISLKNDVEMLNDAWQKMLNHFHAVFIMMDPKAVPTFTEFNQLISDINQNIELSSNQETGVLVEMPSAMNCNIFSSGDVNITKQGCYNCTINAQGKLEVKGFIRGGRVFAGKGAVIDEAGSKGGTKTLIIVPHNQTVTIKHAYYDTTLQIGKKKYTFTKDMTNIVARLDEEGSISIR